MQLALDLARAVATHLDAVGPAFRQAGSPLIRSTYDFIQTVSRQKQSRCGQPSATFRLAEVGVGVWVNHLRNWKAC